MVSSMTGNSDSEEHEDKSKIYSNDIMGDMINTMVKEVKSNNLSEFKKYIENGSSDIKSYVSDIQYSYDVPLNIYMKDTSNGVEQLNPSTMFDSIYGEGATSTSSAMSSGMGMGMFSNSSVWNPVSYTHLDVYKRQRQTKMFPYIFLPCFNIKTGKIRV